MNEKEHIVLLSQKAKLNTEVAMHIIDNQVLKNEIEDLKLEIKRLQKMIASLEDEGRCLYVELDKPLDK